MTTEDDFQAALDAHPDDWQTRLVFADWLEERGDPRADGYRALALNRYVLCDRYSGPPLEFLPHQASRIFLDKGEDSTGWEYTFPPDWFNVLPPGIREAWSSSGCVMYGTRRGAEDAAALAFTKLPAARRAELLTCPRTVPPQAMPAVLNPSPRPEGASGNSPGREPWDPNRE